VFVRLFFTFRHRGVVKPSFWAIAIALLAAVFVALRPATAPTAADRPSFAQVRAIVAERCAVCHADRRRSPGFASAPKNVVLDTPERIVAQAQPIHARPSSQGDADRQPDRDDRRRARGDRRVVSRRRQGRLTLQP
jgi:uncharacterized membrane protein